MRKTILIKKGKEVGRHKKPGPDTPYEIVHETRALVREIYAVIVKGHGQSGGLTPQQMADLVSVGADMQKVIDIINAADR
jgi:hypothetical protein